MKNIFIGGLILIVLLFGASWWSKSTQSKDPNIIATNGIHWHPTLEILVKGVKQAIPANLGIGQQYVSKSTYDSSMNMTALHTHDDADQGIIHLEFGGLVKKEDTKLGNLFSLWGKDINTFSEKVTMTVNGAPNTDLGNYEMKDGDKIILNYE